MEHEPNQFDHQLFKLSVEAFEDRLTDEGWQQLNRLLLENPSASARWQIFMQFHSDLRTFSTISSAEQRVREALANHRPASTHPEIDPEVKAKILALDTPKLARRSIARWAIGLAASLLLVGCGVWWALTNPSNSPLTVGPTGSPVLGLGTVELADGTASYYLPGVGDLLIEGPASLHLDSPKYLRLDQGRIRLRVSEPSGRGFVVATAQGVVTDLGTEFAVDAQEDSGVNLVVFDGAVELNTARGNNPPEVERFEAGEGVSLNEAREKSRIMSIITGSVATFLPSSQVNLDHSPLIVNVSDTLPSNETKQFYEIVPGGFDEDKAAYVDRPYQWNGVTKEGLPKYLVGGDLVRTFNDYKGLEFQLTVEVSQPCHLYVLWDQRILPPDWLQESFEKLDEVVGLDEAEFPGHELDDMALAIGPGNSIGQMFQVWHRNTGTSKQVTLGSIPPRTRSKAMYGIVAVGMDEKSGD